MAGEYLLYYPTPSLSTIYFVETKGATQTWNGTAYEATSPSNWAAYKKAATPGTNPRKYLASISAGIPAGSVIGYDAYLQVGGSPAASDTYLGTESFYWDGTNKLDPGAPFAGGQALQLGDGTTSTYGATSLTRQALTPKVATDVTGQQLRAIAATTNTGAYAVVTGVAGSGVVNFASWVGGLPTGPLTYVFEPVSAGGGGGGSDTPGTTTLLSRIPGVIPANGSGFTALGDARLANLDARVSLAANGGGVFGAGVVSATVSGSVFTVAFGVVVTNPGDSKGSFVILNRDVRIGNARQIVDATSVDPTHIQFTVDPPFLSPPVANLDTVQVG